MDNAKLIATLLAEPEDTFIIAPNEPLLSVRGVGTQRAAELALCGIADIWQLARLSRMDIRRITEQTSWSEQQIVAWIEDARDRLNMKRVIQEVENA